jgi:hypothetical protein
MGWSQMAIVQPLPARVQAAMLDDTAERLPRLLPGAE